MSIWKKVNCEFENYEISNFAEVRNIITGKILKPNTDRYGYLYIVLSSKGKTKKFKIHRLMALTFIPNPLNKNQVNHKDGNKKNNLMYNLEWITHFENQAHKVLLWNRSSKFLGVSYYKPTKKWKAQIQINKIKIPLGYYKTEEEAYQARVNFEKKNGIINKYI